MIYVLLLSSGIEFLTHTVIENMVNVVEWLYRLKRTFQKKINAIIFKYKNNRYAIAFRPRASIPLYDANSTGTEFILIPSTHKYWMADPFLFKYKGVNYLFAELYDKKKSKGVLGYARLKGNRCGRFHVCLKEEYHLSYPCVFMKEDKIYLLPETKEAGKVFLYIATDFPRKWQKHRVVCNKPCVDTTPFVHGGEDYFFTTIANEHSSDDNLYLVSGNDGLIRELLSGNLCLRSAGNVICRNGRIIRPSQDDTVYGDAVIFNQIVCFDKEHYQEVPYRRILSTEEMDSPSQVSIKLSNNRKGVKFDGVHTYNVNEDYEVIDLRYPRMKKHK